MTCLDPQLRSNKSYSSLCIVHFIIPYYYLLISVFHDLYLFITNKIIHKATCRVLNKENILFIVLTLLCTFLKYVNKNFVICLVLLNK